MNSELIISQSDGRPMYQQVMEQVRQKIAIGDWPAGHELPSIRVLAADVKVSVITVKRAYMELEREGLIITRQGRGSFVADDVSIGPRLQREELQHHLEEAVRRARMLGMDLSELLDMVRRVRAETSKDER
jgi:GntR family transcriptional regulator